MTPDWSKIPHRSASLALGCKCLWWGETSIVRFHPACPIANQHYNPGRITFENAVESTAKSLTEGA